MALAALIVAVVAATISVLSFLWTVGWSIYTHRRATRPAVTVRSAWTIPVFGGSLGEQMIGVTATNDGVVPVELTSFKFEIRGRSETLTMIDWALQVPQPLPVRLEPGGYWTGHARIRDLTESLSGRWPEASSWRLRPVVTDASDREYRPPRRKAWLTLSR